MDPSLKRLHTLALTFPSVQSVLRSGDVRPIDLIASLKSREESGLHGSGCTSALCFLMFVWSGNYNAFDLYTAWSRWDDKHREAWLAWAKSPWWA